MISSGAGANPDPDPARRAAPTRRAWSRWADSVSAAVPDGHISLDAVVAFVDEELPPAPARRAAEHVDRCLPCAREVANQRLARRALRGADTPGAPSGLLSSLRSIPLHSRPQRPQPPQHPGPVQASPERGTTGATGLAPDPATGTAGTAGSPARRRRLRRPGA